MAWRNIQFSHLHAARDAGSAAISTGTSFETSKDFLIDDRGGSLCRLGATSANQYIQIDRGAAGLNEIDRLYIPVGHNLNGCTIRLESSASVGMGSPTTMLAATAVVTTTALAYSLTSSTQRYVRLTFQTSGTKWAIGELVLGHIRTPNRGPDAGWTDDYSYPVQIFEKRTGARPAAQFGPRRRVFEFTFRRVTTTELVYFLTLLGVVGITRPFLFDPPFDHEPTLWVSLVDSYRMVLDSKVPEVYTYPHYQLTFSIAEWAA